MGWIGPGTFGGTPIGSFADGQVLASVGGQIIGVDGGVLVLARPGANLVITTGALTPWTALALEGTASLFTTGIDGGGVHYMEATRAVDVEIQPQDYILHTAGTPVAARTIVGHALAATPLVYSVLVGARGESSASSVTPDRAVAGCSAMLSMGAGDRLAFASQRTAGTGFFDVIAAETCVVVRGRL